MMGWSRRVGLIVTALVCAVVDPAGAATVFTDTFDSSASLANWDFSAANTTWTVQNGRLYNGGTRYIDNLSPEAVLIAGVTTPRRFRFSVDMIAFADSATPDFGHMGVIWGVPVGETAPIQNFSASYARVHYNLVTQYSRVNGSYGPEQTYGAGTLVNDVVYRFEVFVDYDARVLTSTLTNGTSVYSQTYTGTTFDTLVTFTGGRIGLMSWQDPVAYDNVVFEDLSVPEPGAIAWGALVVAVAVAGRFGRRRCGRDSRRRLQTYRS